MNVRCLLTAFAAMAVLHSSAQNLPYQWTINETDHRLTIGGVDGDDLYDPYDIKTIEIIFEQSNWWQQLEENYDDQIAIEATVSCNGEVIPQTGVRFKGQTSYFMNNTDKKSFNIKFDEWIDDQDLNGYEALNLQNSFLDPSFMREFLYQRLIRKHIPAAQSAYMHLFLNGQDWGLYPNVEQLNSEFIDEWFLSSSGTRWRADSNTDTGGPGGGGGGGPQWGDGTAALNYLGPDVEYYQEYYTLKTTSVDNPWDALVNTCDILENVPLDELSNELPSVLDVDRTLWFLASEILFSDDDGYCYKGKMDYFLYWEPETGRITPLEYDGNTVMEDQNVNWNAFFHANDVNYPLLHRILQVDEYRQRYLAHMRVLLDEVMNPAAIEEILTSWSAMIDLQVEEDPKKIYSYNQFVNEVEALQSWAEERYDYILSNNEVAEEGVAIASVSMSSEEGEWVNPNALQGVDITATVDGMPSLVNLFWSNELVGNFTKTEMTAEGGNYNATLPGQIAGTVVRFYIETVADNASESRVYAPSGAEHDTYFYVTEAMYAESSDVVINELMAKNDEAVFDETNEADDWIELYNKGTEAIDLTGYHLTDNLWNLDKWPIPEGYVLQPDEYLVIWADEDGADGPYHANFKLDGSGETIVLLNGADEIVDLIEFGDQTTDVAFARSPNGTGNFIQQGQTLGSSNDGVSVEETQAVVVSLYPNPTNNNVTIALANKGIQQAEIYSVHGALMWYGSLNGKTVIQTGDWADGLYIVTSEQIAERFVVRH